eukprot:14443178-Ditylum_brightwellii.AAC.1
MALLRTNHGRRFVCGRLACNGTNDIILYRIHTFQVYRMPLAMRCGWEGGHCKQEVCCDYS